MALNKSLALREDRVNFLLLAFDLVLPGVGDTPVLLGQDRFQGRDSLGIGRDMGFVEGGDEFLGSLAGSTFARREIPAGEGSRQRWLRLRW